MVFAVERFGGLDLRSDPAELGPERAVDVLNVDLDRQGRLRTRDGSEVFTDAEGTNRYDSLWFFPGSDEIIVGAGNRLEAIDSAGAVTHSSTAPTVSPHHFANFGSPTVEAVYISNGTDQIRKYSGGAFSSPAGLSTQTGKLVAAWQTRLVHACTATNLSRVSFSNAGDAETFGADDWVDVSPGDGEPVTALATWGPYLFAFKETKFAVFTATSQDGTGGAIFNFRMVDTGVGCVGGYATAASPEGLYFVASDGVYVTGGDSPRRVSETLEPLFREDIPLGYGGGYIQTSADFRVQLVYRESRLYMAVTDSEGTNLVFVYDPRRDDWTTWAVNAGPIGTVTFESDGRTLLVFGYASGLKHIGRMLSSQTTDAGTAISWRYRSGSYDMGSPAQEKLLRDVVVWGSGTVTVQMAVDLGDPDTGSAVTLGTAPAVGSATQATSRVGVLFSHCLSGTGRASVHRMSHGVRAVRGEGLRA